MAGKKNSRGCDISGEHGVAYGFSKVVRVKTLTGMDRYGGFVDLRRVGQDVFFVTGQHFRILENDVSN